MTNRAPIERWSRGELEDRFHSVADNFFTLKQKNNRLEREMKILNGRISGRHFQKAQNGGQKDEMDELHRTNQLMAQKLKVLKHQLLNYTKVNSTSLTGRYRSPTAAAQKQQQKNVHGHRLQSPISVDQQTSTSADGHPKKARMMPSDIEQPIHGKKRPISQPVAMDKRYEEFVERDEANFQTIRDEAERENEQSENLRLLEKSGGANLRNEMNDKLREMQRQNRKLTDENDELRFSLDKIDQRLSALRRENDRLVRELSQAQRELRSQSDSLNSVREDAQRRAEGSARSVEIADRELAIAREECRTLRNANQRLVEKSLEQENSGKAALEELMRVQSQWQQNAKENELERKEWEADMQTLRRENAKLRETKDKETEERVKEKEKESSAKQNGHQTDEKQRKMKQNELIENEAKEKQKQQQQGNGGDVLLNKLFTDVIGIVEGHFDPRNKSANFPIGAGNSDEKWQQLYEDVYFELEKVRKLLLSEHKMNVQLKEEKSHILAELDFTKVKFEKQMAELKGDLEERAKQIVVLENELEFVAKSGQIRHSVLLNTANKKVPEQSEKASSFEPTELTLQISKIVLTEEAIRQAQNPCPMLFLAIEFFDFEIQTTKVLNGPEAIFDFTTVFDAPISDLFIHYIQTEGMEIELYSVRDGLSYELWSKAQLPMKKLLSIQTPTQFHGELKFRALSNDSAAVDQPQQLPLLLATAFYSIKVPFSLLRALNAQRRRMVASAMIPISTKDHQLDEPFNELIVQIHRCTSIDKLKGDVTADDFKKANKLSLSTYVAYEFFNFPVHMTRTVRESANPKFDDRHNWQLPFGSEAVHKYLREKELLFYLIDEGSDGDALSDKISPKARVLASIHLPLFPLARNHQIRGTFALMDRANESITSEASIDVSIYWKFAYVFDGLENVNIEEKVPLKIFHPKTDEPKEAEAKEQPPSEGALPKKEAPKKPPEAMPRRGPITKEQTAQETMKTKGIFVPSAANISIQSESDEADDQSTEQMSEGELRRRLLLLPEPMKATVAETADPSKISEPSSIATPKSSSSSATIIVDRDKTLERTTSDDISEDLLKEDSYSDDKEEKKDETDEEEEEDVRSIRSDATYIAEGPLGPIEMDEPLLKGVEDEEEMIVRDEDLEDRTDRIHAEKGSPKEAEEQSAQIMAPVPAQRRTLLGPLQPIAQRQKPPAPLPPTAPELLTTARKAVDFAEPLHSSIPPSDVSSSSFAEDTTLGSGHSSNSFEADETNTTPRQIGEDGQQEEQKAVKKQHQNKKPKKAPIEMGATPTMPAIRIRPIAEPAQGDGGSSESTATLAPPSNAKVEVKIGKLRLLDHSPMHFSQFDEGRVFVEWNFLDFPRDQCVTERDLELPRLSAMSANFEHQSAYELNQNRIALLSQWTELNIRLTFTLVMDPGEGNGGDLDDLCMGELDLLDVLDSSAHSLLMRNVDNLSMAVLEVDVKYSDSLQEYMREAMHGIMGGENAEDEQEEEEEEEEEKEE